VGSSEKSEGGREPKRRWMPRHGVMRGGGAEGNLKDLQGGEDSFFQTEENKSFVVVTN